MSALRSLLRRPAGAVGAAIVLVVAAVALLAPWLAPYDPLAVDLARKLAPPSAAHWLGTDQTGRDVLSRLLWGARPSLAVGLLAVVIGLLGGVTLGVTAAMLRGWWEQVAMRSMDGLASIPMLIWAIAIVGIIGVGPLPLGPFMLPNESKIVLLVGVLYMPPLARVAHGGALLEARADYVQARRLQGARTLSIMLGDVLPNCLSPVVVQATLLIAVGIVVEASLSFVGLGVEPPLPSWGGMLADARRFIFSGEWWTYVFPGLAISVTVIGFNLLGDALRDTLDPRKTAGAGRVVI
ncbi:ABC transporter permease [Roseomonas haemaphysalidis]|uniref:ABC transporter permease n=1 Tax=Roseomonas haemaphysalidis TaxID=2768162 RepID=A0ABS3KKU0_9PROT|nr:ABC transporter permease [Roseomonas haemaphysalidis]MBO1078091.1 ABC transporter permease [Roseomonas haemaphysalidis]